MFFQTLTFSWEIFFVIQLSMMILPHFSSYCSVRREVLFRYFGNYVEYFQFKDQLINTRCRVKELFFYFKLNLKSLQCTPFRNDPRLIGLRPRSSMKRRIWPCPFDRLFFSNYCSCLLRAFTLLLATSPFVPRWTGEI